MSTLMFSLVAHYSQLATMRNSEFKKLCSRHLDIHCLQRLLCSMNCPNSYVTAREVRSPHTHATRTHRVFQDHVIMWYIPSVLCYENITLNWKKKMNAHAHVHTHSPIHEYCLRDITHWMGPEGSGDLQLAWQNQSSCKKIDPWAHFI